MSERNDQPPVNNDVKFVMHEDIPGSGVFVEKVNDFHMPVIERYATLLAENKLADLVVKPGLSDDNFVLGDKSGVVVDTPYGRLTKDIAVVFAFMDAEFNGVQNVDNESSGLIFSIEPYDDREALERSFSYVDSLVAAFVEKPEVYKAFSEYVVKPDPETAEALKDTLRRRNNPKIYDILRFPFVSRVLVNQLDKHPYFVDVLLRSTDENVHLAIFNQITFAFRDVAEGGFEEEAVAAWRAKYFDPLFWIVREEEPNMLAMWDFVSFYKVIEQDLREPDIIHEDPEPMGNRRKSSVFRKLEEELLQVAMTKYIDNDFLQDLAQDYFNKYSGTTEAKMQFFTAVMDSYTQDVRLDFRLSGWLHEAFPIGSDQYIVGLFEGIFSDPKNNDYAAYLLNAMEEYVRNNIDFSSEHADEDLEYWTEKIKNYREDLGEKI